MERKARPLGLTLLAQSIHSRQTLDEKAIHQLINYSLNHNLCYNNKPATIEVLANLLGISLAAAYKHYIEHTSRVANLINPKDIQGLYLGQIFGLLAGASGTIRDIQAQKRILQAAQGNEYVAFLSGELNNLLSTEMGAFEKMVKMTEALTKTIDPRALPQDAPGAQEKAIGVNEALKLLEAQGQLSLTYSNEQYTSLKESHNLTQLPVVVANKQTGNTDDERLVKMGKAHHRNRRAKELDIAEEEEG